MNQTDIARINELYHRQKTCGLTDKEKEEQKELRRAYIESVKRNMRANLDNVSVVNEDGSISKLSDIRKKHNKR
mgnify:CR=1 FL=1